VDNNDDNGNSNLTIMIEEGSELFEDFDGRLYRVVRIDLSMQYIQAGCCYPKRNNDLFGTEKSFDIQLLTKESMELRLNGY
jgi:hypothetical protein